MTGTVITAWSAVSATGLGRRAHTGALGGSRTPTTASWGAPQERVHLVPDAALGTVLGRKGTRSMDRVTALALAAVGDLVGADRPGTDRLGLVLGTTTGSAQSMMDFTRSSLEGDRPFLVDPARFPNTVMNCAAGQCAIWHRLTGPNATVAGGRTAGLHALNYGSRLVRAGRAGAVLCGGVEELTPARGWLEWHSASPGESPAALGEGCAVLLLEPGPGERGPLAEVVAVEFAAVTGAGAADALAACVRRGLDRAGVHPSELWAVAPCGAGEQEATAIEAVLGGHDHVLISATDVVGDTRAASAAFQVAALLAAPRPADRLALVTSVDTEGVVGCALLLVLSDSREA